MAEVIRITESAEPAGTAALPQNVEAEAAVALGQSDVSAWAALFYAVALGWTGVFAVIAALLGLVASIAPAIRASRIKVLEAISYE